MWKMKVINKAGKLKAFESPVMNTERNCILKVKKKAPGWSFSIIRNFRFSPFKFVSHHRAATLKFTASVVKTTTSSEYIDRTCIESKAHLLTKHQIYGETAEQFECWSSEGLTSRSATSAPPCRTVSPRVSLLRKAREKRKTGYFGNVTVHNRTD